MAQDKNESTVVFTGKLRAQIEEKAKEAGLTFEEYVKASMSISINEMEN